MPSEIFTGLAGWQANFDEANADTIINIEKELRRDGHSEENIKAIISESESPAGRKQGTLAEKTGPHEVQENTPERGSDAAKGVAPEEDVLVEEEKIPSSEVAANPMISKKYQKILEKSFLYERAT